MEIRPNIPHTSDFASPGSGGAFSTSGATLWANESEPSTQRLRVNRQGNVGARCTSLVQLRWLRVPHPSDDARVLPSALRAGLALAALDGSFGDGCLSSFSSVWTIS
jgi:hypothetical protein